MENSQKSQRKGVIALGVTVVVLVLAVLGFIIAYYFQADRIIDLEHQTTDLKASVAEKDRAIAKNAMEAAKPAAQAQYREIPELGVKYKVTDETKYLTYSFDQQIAGTKIARFSTVQLVSMKDSEGLYPCSQGFSGMIVGNDKKPLVRDGVEVKEIAGRFYTNTPPQNACMIDGVVAPGLKESYSSVKAAFDSLEAM